MDENLENRNGNMDESVSENGNADKKEPVYTDPNADVKPEEYAQTGYGEAQERAQTTYGQQYQYGQQNQQYQYGQQNQQYQYSQQDQQYQYSQQGQQNQQYQYSQDQQTSYGQAQSDGFQQNQQYQYSQQGQQNQPNEYYYHQHSDNYTGMDTSPMSMGDWILTILVMMIPCVGIVLYFVWAFSSNGNVNRRNFCRAQLIITGVVLVLYIILAVVFGIAVISNRVY